MPNNNYLAFIQTEWFQITLRQKGLFIADVFIIEVVILVYTPNEQLRKTLTQNSPYGVLNLF